MATSAITGSTPASGEYINAAQQKAAQASSMPDESMFLQLLVAQIKNQDPSNPSDGMQFVAQLAQFSQLEQTIAIRKDADAISDHITGAAETTETAPEE